jgi:integrase
MANIRKRTWTTNGVKQTAWVLDYKDTAGKRRLKTFPTRKAAEAWSVTALHEVKQGTHTPASISITVSEGMDLWIAGSDALEYGTVKQRKEHKRLHIDPFIGAAKLAALTAPRVYELDDKLREAGRSLAMRRKVLSSLKSMLTFCQGKGRVAQNVASAVKIKSDDKRDTAPVRAGVDFPSRDELRTILDKAEGRWRPLVIAAIFTGMRASELRGLPWANVDLDGGVIHVRQRADHWGKIGKPKSKAGNRDIPLTPMAINALRAWRDQCPPGSLGLVFPNEAGGVEHHKNILRGFWEPFQIAWMVSRNTGSTPSGTPPRVCLSPIWDGHRRGCSPCSGTRLSR